MKPLRRLFGILLATCVFMGLFPLRSAAASELTLQQNAQTLVLENRQMRLTLNRDSGAIRELYAKSSDLYLTKDADDSEPLRLYRRNNALLNYTAFSYSVEQNTSEIITLALRWDYSDGLLVRASVSLSADADEAVFRLRVENNRLFDPVIRVEYPIVENIETLVGGDTDCFATPFLTGYVFKNPLENFNGDFHGITEALGEYPSGWAYPMQFSAYYAENKGGFYWQTRDGGDTVKSFTFVGENGSLRLGISHYAGSIASGTIDFDYDIALACLQEGSWYAAAERYRLWAQQQSWAQQAGLLGNRTDTDTTLYEDTTLTLFGLRVTDAPTQWQSIYDIFKERISGSFLNIAIYMNSDYLSKIKQQHDLLNHFEFNTLCLHSAAPEGSDFYQAAMRSENGQKKSFSIHYYECAAEKKWLDYQLSRDAGYIQDEGVDGFYYDVSIAADHPKLCYDTSHRHGTRVNVVRDFLAQIAAAKALENGDKRNSVGTELIFEQMLPYVNYYQARANSGLLGWMEHDRIRALLENGTAQQVPMFDFVYHANGIVRTDGYLVPDSRLGDGFYAVAAKTVLNGGIPEFNYEYYPQQALPTLSQQNTDFLDFINCLGALRTGVGKEFLVYGTMERAPQISNGTFRAAYENPNYTPGICNNLQTLSGTAEHDCVVTSAFSHNGQVGLFFCNVTNSVQTVHFTLQAERDYGIEAGDVYLQTEQTGQYLTSLQRGKAQITLQLEPKKPVLLRLTPGNAIADASFDTAAEAVEELGNWTTTGSAALQKETVHAAILPFNAPQLEAFQNSGISQKFTVQPGKTYLVTLTAICQASENSPIQPLQYGIRGEGMQTLQYSTADLGADAQNLVFEFTAGQNSTATLFASVASIHTGEFGSYYISDISVIPLNPTEMLTDGSFDTPATVMTDGTLPSFRIWTTMSWASVLSEPENAHTGNGLAHLVFNAPGLPANEYPTIYQDVAVTPGANYEVSFYVKKWATVDQNAPLYYGYRNALANVWTPVEQFVAEDIGTEYQKISFTFNAANLTAVRIFAFVHSINTGDAGGYHIDDFSMQKIVYDGGMIEDASFNNAMTPMTDGTLPSVGAWTAVSWANALNEPANAHSGSGLAHLVFDSPALPANEYPTIYQDVPVETNTDYQVSFYAKRWSTSEVNAPLYYGYRNALADVWTPVEQFSVDTVGPEYQKISFTFNSGALTRVRIFAFVCSVNTGALGGYHIDDFSMQKIDEESSLQITSAYLTLNDNIDVTYAVTVPADCTDPYMVFTMNGISRTVTDYTVADGKRLYTFTGVTPQQMGDNISAAFYATKNAETVSDTVAEYSIKEYCENQLERYADDTDLVALLSDLLTYGAAAQIYTGYHTEALVTAGLDLTPSTFAAISGKSVSFAGEKDADIDWSSATLVLRNALALRLCFIADSVESLTVTASINGRGETFDASDFVAAGEGKYYVDFCGIKATEFDDAVTASFAVSGTAVGRSICYSVNTYICGAQNDANANLRALVRALYNYGASAAAYK